MNGALSGSLVHLSLQILHINTAVQNRTRSCWTFGGFLLILGFSCLPSCLTSWRGAPLCDWQNKVGLNWVMQLDYNPKHISKFPAAWLRKIKDSKVWNQGWKRRNRVIKENDLKVNCKGWEIYIYIKKKVAVGSTRCCRVHGISDVFQRIWRKSHPNNLSNLILSFHFWSWQHSCQNICSQQAEPALHIAICKPGGNLLWKIN